MNYIWLDNNEIFKYQCITRDTVCKWIEQEKMPTHQLGRKWLFRKDEVDAWVKSGKTKN